ncbi:MAG: hypothetical protein RIT41_1664, partial [Bacteroidota bacterium]
STLDNYNDKMLNALYKDPTKRLLEGERSDKESSITSRIDGCINTL